MFGFFLWVSSLSDSSVNQRLRCSVSLLRTLFPLFLITIACCAVFAQESTSYYRVEGRLGSTVPPYQQSIVEGTAEPPFVYRQSVPQLRRGLQSLGMKPGHAAFGLDFFFFVIGLMGAAGLAIYTVGRSPEEGLLDGLRMKNESPVVSLAAAASLAIFTVAAVASYGYAKPEAIATVTSITWIVVLLVYDQPLWALALSVASVGFRPLTPILFGTAVGGSRILVLGRSVWKRNRTVLGVAAGSVITGISYLLLSRHVWFAHLTPYYERDPMQALHQNLIGNLTHPPRWHGLTLWLVLSIVAIGWAWRAWRSPGKSTSEAVREKQLAVALFAGAWLLAVGLLGKLDEIRLMMPVLVPISILVAGRWRL